MNQLRSLAKSVLEAFGVAYTPRNEAILTGITIAITGLFLVGAVLSSLPRTDFSVAEPVAQILLSPSTSTVTPGSTQSIKLRADSGGLFVDGFQAFINISGSVPTNLAFAPANLTGTGLKFFTSGFTDQTAGKQFKLLIITEDPTTPYKASGLFDLGTFTYTAPASGQMTFAFDTTLTKIVDHATNSNVAIVPSPSVYTFSNPTTSTSASSSVSSSSSSAASSSSSSSSSVSSSSSSASSTSSAAAATVDLKASFNGGAYTNGPLNIPVNSSVTFSWTSTGATSCFASSSPNNLSGTVGPSGTATVQNITTNSTFTMTCGGATDTVQVIVSIAVSSSSSSSASTTTSSASSSSSSASSSAVNCGASQTWNGSKCVPLACNADYNHSGSIDIVDFALFAQNYKKTGITCSYDIVGGNCLLDIFDFLEFAKNYGVPNLCN